MVIMVIYGYNGTLSVLLCTTTVIVSTSLFRFHSRTRKQSFHKMMWWDFYVIPTTGMKRTRD